MARTEMVRDAQAQAYADLAQFVSLHAGDPGLTGANQVGVIRMPVTWFALGAGRIDSQAISFLIPANTMLTHVGFWTAATGGLFVDSAVHVAEIEAEGTYRFVFSYTQV